MLCGLKYWKNLKKTSQAINLSGLDLTGFLIRLAMAV